MFKRANIEGLAKAILSNMTKSAAGYYSGASNYGAQLGMQNGNHNDAIWNHMYDANKAGVDYDTAVRDLNIGIQRHNGWTGNEALAGGGVRVRQGNGQGAVNDVDANDSYRDDMYAHNYNQAKNAIPKTRYNARVNIPGMNIMSQVAAKSNNPAMQNYTATTNAANAAATQAVNSSQFKGNALGKHTIASNVARTNTNNAMAQKKPRVQYTGANDRYASNATTWNGGKMGMTVDPNKTQQRRNAGFSYSRTPGRSGRFVTMTSNADGKKTNMRVNRDGSLTYVS